MNLPPRNFYRLAVFFEGGLALAALGLGALFNIPLREMTKWETPDAFYGAGFCIPMLLVLLVCRKWRIPPLVRLNRVVDELVVPLFRGRPISQLASISLLAGLGEELLFRGVLQTLLTGWLKNPWASLAVVSVIFGLLHAITPTYAILAALIGAYLGWTAIYTNNLFVPMVAHGLYDFFALVLLTQSGRRPLESG